MQDQGRIKSALMEVGLEVVEITASAKQVRIVARSLSQEKARDWAQKYISRLLQGQLGASWSVDISRWYMLRGTGTVWAWRIILQADDLEIGVSDFLSFWGSMLPAKVVMEQPLVGMRNLSPSADPRSPLGMGKGVVPTQWGRE